jgi:hypothetical protein
MPIELRRKLEEENIILWMKVIRNS